jgi:hypothetical protein
VEVDEDLVRRARRFIDGANVHRINSWTVRYTTSLPNTPRRERYAALLRDFVQSKTLIHLSRNIIETQRKQLYAVPNNGRDTSKH